MTDMCFIRFKTTGSNISESEMVLLSICLIKKHNTHCCGACFHQLCVQILILLMTRMHIYTTRSDNIKVKSINL